MRELKIRRYAVPLWLLAVILVSLFGSVIGYYVWKTLNVPLEVKEPIEVLNYPTQLSLYAGENLAFDITVNNHASLNYSVVLDFRLNNATYQNNYVEFSREVYTVTPGQQTLKASLSVDSGAPSADESLTIDFLRYAYPYTLTNGLIAYWKFNEGQGPTASDSSGNNNNGTLVGPTWVNGKYGKALSFDGVNDMVDIPTLFSSSPSAMTISVWMNSPMTKLGRVFDHEDNGAIAIEAGELYSNATMKNPQSVGFGFIATDRSIIGIYSGPITPNVWHHIVGVWTKGVVIRIYVDGMVAAESTTIPDLIPLDPGPSYLATIGAYNRGAIAGDGWDRLFNGTIDNLMVYNRALTVEEVETLYASPPP